MADPYEKFADIFMASMAGELASLSREQLVALCKANFPVEEEFVKKMEMLSAHAEMQIEQAQANLKPGQMLAVGYPVEVPRGPLH